MGEKHTLKTTTTSEPSKETTTTQATTDVQNNLQPCVRPKDTFYWGDLPRNNVRSESPKAATAQQSTQNQPNMAGIHPVQKTTLDNTELILVRIYLSLSKPL